MQNKVDDPTGYYDLLVDGSIGAKVSNVAIIGGVLGFVCHKNGIVMGSADIEWCYRVVYLVCVVISLNVMKVGRAAKFVAEDYTRFVTMWCRGCEAGRFYMMMVVKYLLLCGAAYLGVSVVCGSDWVIGERNIFPVMVLSIVSSVYSFLCFVIIIRHAVGRFAS